MLTELVNNILDELHSHSTAVHLSRVCNLISNTMLAVSGSNHRLFSFRTLVLLCTELRFSCLISQCLLKYFFGHLTYCETTIGKVCIPAKWLIRPELMPVFVA